MDKCEKGAISSFLVEQLSDIERVHTYVEGKSNYISDAVSRYPLLGPKRIAPRGLLHSLSDLLTRLPDRLRSCKDVHAHAGSNTSGFVRTIQAWRTAKNPVSRVAPATQRPPPDVDLAIFAPPPDRTPQIVARYLCSTTPFAVYMPIDLATEILDSRIARQASLDPDLLRRRFDDSCKITILATQMLWIVGNVPELHQHAATYSTTVTPAPLFESHAAVAGPARIASFAGPSTIEEWTQAQADDPDCLKDIPAAEVVVRDSLHLHLSPGHSPRIIVPESCRENLIRQHHSDIFHLGPDKTIHSLRKAYYWPKMESQVRRVLQDCAQCELAKARRNAAHAMFRDRPLAGPRRRVCMDFQGQTKAVTGHIEACAIIDEFSRYVVVLPLHSRSAAEFTPAFADAVIFDQGPPDIVHSDAAKTFLSDFQKCLVDTLGITRTTSLGHNPTGNAMVEIFWRYWNRCMRLLSGGQIRHWPQYAKRICFAYNTAVHDSTSVTPFELHHGVPARDPFAPGQRHDLDAPLPDISPTEGRTFAHLLRESVQAFTALARDHSRYVQQTTAERLNEHGFARSYNVGDHVKVMIPPSASDIARTGRPAKHMYWWTGPCEVVAQLSDTAYRVRSLDSNRHYERTAINLARFRATTPRDFTPPAFIFVPDQVIAIRDTPQSDFYLARTISAEDHILKVHYLGSQSGNLQTAVFRKCWSFPDSAQISLSHHQPQRSTPWTGDVDIDSLDDLLVAQGLELTANHRLAAASRRKLAPVANELYVFAR